MKKWNKYLSVIIVVAGVFGYLLSMLVANSQWQGESPPDFYQWILLVKNIFFSALKMLVGPIVFFSLLGGLLNFAKVGSVGKLGRYTLLYYISTTTIAIMIGLVVVFFVHPWESSPVESSKEYTVAKKIDKKDSEVSGVAKKLLGRVFVNPIQAFVDNNILGIVFWAFVLGMAFLLLQPRGSPIPKLVEEANGLLFLILSWVLYFAPLGVFAIAFDFQIRFAGAIVTQLVSFCIVVFAATMVHGLIVLPLFVHFLTDVSVGDFFKKSIKALVLAFSTSSSSATLPVSMSVAEGEFKASKSVSGFVLPLGATMNMDGTALFEGIAAVFLAYVFGIELSSVQMISIFLMAMLSSIGAPGMPSGSMSGMQMVLIAAGIPLEGIGLLLVVERMLDTFRTAVNVEGDIVGTLVVDKWMKKSHS